MNARNNHLRKSDYKVVPLDELQWWPIEVISNSILGVAVGVLLGFSGLGVLPTILIACGALAIIFIVGALCRQKSKVSTLVINAPIEQVYEAVLQTSGQVPLFRSLWGIVLRVGHEPDLLELGGTVDTEYEFYGHKGSISLSVTEASPPHRLTQEAQNKFRGRVTQGSSVTSLKTTSNGTQVTHATHLTLPIGASHLIGAIYSHIVLNRTTLTFLELLHQTSTKR